MVAGDKARVLAARQHREGPGAAAGSRAPAGRRWAPAKSCGRCIRRKSTPEVKRQILQALFVGGDATRLIEVANTEQNVELRRRAVQHLGTMGRTKTGEALVGIYAKEKDVDIKRR